MHTPIYNEKSAHGYTMYAFIAPRGAILTFAPVSLAETQKVPEKRILRHFDNSDYCV